MKSFVLLTTVAVLFAAASDIALAARNVDNQTGIQQRDRDRDQDCDQGTCTECGYIDEDGDGICDNCGACIPKGEDDDGDGIPNGQDSDYAPPRDGSGRR